MKKIIMISLLAVSLPFSVAWTSLADIPLASESSVLPVIETSENSANEGDLSILSEQEISDLMFMLEEEKMAHNVYIFLYELWGLPVFQNIAISEQTHMESVQYLLDLYNINDPTEGMGLGQFNNEDLQALYNQLIGQGSQSLSEALKAGSAIEEIDILDLQDTIQNSTQLEIQRVYGNLMQGSFNHLKAFTNTLQMQTGETYQPQYLSAEEYQAVLSGNMGYMGNGMGSMTQGQQGQWVGRGRKNTF